ncbi:MAG: glycoside hydrolase family 3 C-terminal domain-containing protein [Verrucomicrobia bacterium]|nr:glycoside hydrolase family 3 C-terminal domain-containing protein [Verrucomicrobiota bacterium]
MRLVDPGKVILIGLFINACNVSVRGEQGQSTAAPGDVDTRVNTIFSQLAPDAKLSYIGGTGFFDLKPVPPVPDFPGNLNPQIYQTDAGLGVRRNSPGVRFPSGLTLAATWNPNLAREQGAAMGQDTRARGYFAIEGPGMDVYRVPLGGRNFEYLTGEDPFLGSELAVQEVLGIQSQGAWACAKHYVCNDEEENRTEVNIRVDERTLREIYLPPFEASVKAGHVATVMGAYDKVNGDWCCENSFLLQKVLKGDWGFTGILVSDYEAIHNGVRAALNGCDVDLPAGKHMNPATLGPVISAGLLPVSTIDDKVRRILRGVISFGFLDRQQLDPAVPLDNPYSERVALEIAREGIVLLKNRVDLLPFGPGVRSIAVLGARALGAPPTGFGSSYVTPISWVSELDGIRSAAAPGTRVDYIPACTPRPEDSAWEHIDEHGEIAGGLKGEYFANNYLSGQPAATRIDLHLNLEWTTGITPETASVATGQVPPQIPSTSQATFSARWSGQIRPQIPGAHVFKVRGDGGLRLSVEGRVLIDNFNNPDLPSIVYGPTPARSARIDLQAGRTYRVVIEYRRVKGFFNSFEQGGLQGIQASWAALQAPPGLEKYDAVVMCLGLGEEYEGEGCDRAFQLPEFEDELIRNLSRVNPHTVVCLHGGGNFDSLPWIDQAGACLHTFYPGQNGGQALAEILFGRVNPSGKLPVTFERRLEDNPAYATFPEQLHGHTAEIAYAEGLYIGYRGYEKRSVTPLFPFGYGLSYTTFDFSGLKVTPAAFDGTAPVTVTFIVKNTGQRAGAEVAQLYVRQNNPPIERPIKELKGFRKVYLDPGQSEQVSLTLDQRSVAYWNTATQQWTALPGSYTVLVGASSQDIRLSGDFSLTRELTAGP